MSAPPQSAPSANQWPPPTPLQAVTNDLQVQQFQPADPTGTSSTTGIMMGLAILLTPQKTGRFLVLCEGQLNQTTTADGIFVQLRQGTGAAPANGAAFTGTSFGKSYTWTALTGMLTVPFTQNALLTGMVIGTQIWIDLLINAVTAGTASVTRLNIVIYEI